jgi:hypothetical protein
MRLRVERCSHSGGQTHNPDTAEGKDPAVKAGRDFSTRVEVAVIGRVRASRRPLSTAKAICRDYLKVDQHRSECDPSDVQELWVKVFKRQGRLIYPEQERIFRQLDRSAIQGNLNRGDLERADKILRMFKAPGTVDRSWAKAEQLANVEPVGLGPVDKDEGQLVGRAILGRRQPKEQVP